MAAAKRLIQPREMNDGKASVLTAAPTVSIAQPVSASPASATSPRFANQRTKKDYAKAKRHTWLVRFLRLALPLSAVGIVLVFAATIIFSISPISDVAIKSIGFEDGNLVMESPNMAGFDRNNRPYDVKASKASQDLKNSNLIELEDIVANLPMDEKSQVNVQSDHGTYDSEAETMVLRDNVTIKGARGMNIELQQADVDMKTGSMTSDKPIVVKSDKMNITADSVLVENNGDRIVFRKRVVTIIQPGSIDRTSESKDSQ